MRRMKLRGSSGQTLIEVIIAIGLVTLVLLTLVSALTLALRNNQFAKDQVLAKNRSRDTLEWLRSLRDQMGWDSLVTMVTQDSPPVTYCLPDLPTTLAATAALTNGACSATDVIPGTRYIRQLVLSVPNTDEIDATVVVSWIDGGKLHQSQSTLILKKWL